MSTTPIERYGKKWPGYTNLQIEFFCIQKGKQWCQSQGRSLYHHYRECFKIIWPSDDLHRWNELVLRRYTEEDVLVLIGSSDAGKTDTMAKIVLVDYWAVPDKTLWLVSTTEGRGAELRIWGHIKDLFNRALSGGHAVSGHPIDHLKTITSDTIDEDGEMARSLKRGIIIVPCKSGGLSSGLGPYIGIKAPRLRHCGDEVAVMGENFLHAYSNWYGKMDFKGIMAGNFMETDDPLGRASEPIDGWDSFEDTKKTQEWRSRFYDAWVVALDGRDSPNFDFPKDQPQKYSYIIGHKKLDMIRKTFGEDSWEWYSQCTGKPAKGMDVWRVISKAFCEQNGAFEDIVWKGNTLVSIYGLDPSYGDGDRCVGRNIKFGDDIDGNLKVWVGPAEIVPIKANISMDPEDQIAEYIKERLSTLGIPPENCFYDSFGRGTLGFAFSKIGINPIPVDSGAQPTDRPVSEDLFVEERGRRRLKTCREHYKKFVTEMWFSVRLLIGCKMVRGIDLETVKEGQSRKFTRENGFIEVETKKDMKKRLGRSPDLFDCLCWVPSTMILTPSGMVEIGDLKVGDLVVTPFGNTEIAYIHESFTNEISTAKFNDGTELTGRKKHGVFTWDKGWVPLSNLSVDNAIESVDNLWIWNILNLWFTKEKNITFKQLVATIPVVRKLAASDFYTGLSGGRIMEKFQMECASIIKIMIGQITESRIWSWLKNPHMLPTTCERIGGIQKAEPSSWQDCQKDWNPLRSGTDRKMAGLGTQKTGSEIGKIPHLKEVENANFANPILSSSAYKRQNSALIPVCKKLLVGVIVRTVFASCVALRSMFSSTKKQKLALVRVVQNSPTQIERVLNLTLWEHNVYYANGILVENCIGIEGCRRRGLKISRLLDPEIQTTNGVMTWFMERQRKSLENRSRGQLTNA